MIMCKMTSKQGKNMSCTCALLQTCTNPLTKKKRCDIINKLSRKAAKSVERGSKKITEKSLKKHLTNSKSCDIINKLS